MKKKAEIDKALKQLKKIKRLGQKITIWIKKFGKLINSDTVTQQLLKELEVLDNRTDKKEVELIVTKAKPKLIPEINVPAAFSSDHPFELEELPEIPPEYQDLIEWYGVVIKPYTTFKDIDLNNGQQAMAIDKITEKGIKIDAIKNYLLKFVINIKPDQTENLPKVDFITLQRDIAP